MAVGTQRDHLLGMVRAAFREILDMVNFQDRVTGIGDVLRLTRAVWTLAVPVAAQQHGTTRRLQAQHVNARPRAAKPGAAIVRTGADPAEATVLLFQRAPDHDHVTSRDLIVGDASGREPRVSQDCVIVGTLEILIHYQIGRAHV